MTLDPDQADALRREHYNATILGERVHHGTVIVFSVRPDGEAPVARPGQWMELGLGVWEPVREGAEPGSAQRLPRDGIIRRAYSLSSPILTPDHSRLITPEEQMGYEFFLSLVIPPAARALRVPNLTGRLFALSPGDRLFLSDAPRGIYNLDPVGEDDDVLFLATGTGEAPHNLMIWGLLGRGHRGRIASIVSVRYREDLAYDTVHRKLEELFPNYRYGTLATREPGSDGRHLQALLTSGDLETLAGFPLRAGGVHVFLCGNPGMIGPPRRFSGTRVFPEDVGMVELLEARGLNADLRAGTVDVHYERYW